MEGERTEEKEERVEGNRRGAMILELGTREGGRGGAWQDPLAGVNKENRPSAHPLPYKARMQLHQVRGLV